MPRPRRVPTGDSAAHAITVRLTEQERDQLTGICQRTKRTVSEIFRTSVLVPPPKVIVAPRGAALRPPAAGSLLGMTDWPTDALDNAIYMVLSQLERRVKVPPVSLGRLYAAMDQRGVEPGRMPVALLRLQRQGRLELFHTRATRATLALRAFLPEGPRARAFTAAWVLC